MEVQCTSCGTLNSGQAKFCGECGARLSVTCASCGTASTPGQRFCAECGASLATAASAVMGSAVHERTAPDAPVAERRVCAVLFCDLVGFTTLSEGIDPEQGREILSEYFAVARTIVGRYGGIVEKFIGDAVMAVWGTPIATEDDSERAVRAGLGLIDEVRALGTKLGLESFAARVGIVTGETAVTIGASGEGMVAGDAVNTAARIQATAAPGCVLVDESTRRASQSSIAYDDAGSHALKGKAEPQHLWRAERVLSGVGGSGRVDGLEAALIGRDVESRLIKDLFHATVARRQPRLVIVSGAAGSGKSRLGWEFEKYIDGLSTTVLWHRGRCLSYGEGVAFWALAEVVRQRLGIAEEDSIEVGAEKLVAGIDRFLTDPAERMFVGVRLGRLLGLPFPGDDGDELQRESLFAGWRTWFVRLAENDSVVLLFEDLHYADAGLLEFIDHVLDWARNCAIYLVVFARPELDELHPAWVFGRHRQQVAVEPLDEPSMTQLLDALVPGMPESAASAISAQAHGIPLFAIETIRSLIDRDIVVAHEGRYRLVRDIGELEVPDSLRALLAARLDNLEPRSRSLVADASVLGDTFPAGALAAVTGRPQDQVDEDLRLLVQRELFTVSADALSPQQGFYQFAHEMLRRVAYETLSKRDRKARHIVVAHHLRRTFPNDGDEVADVIARHLLDAADAVPGAQDVAALREQAVTDLVRAGDRARRTGAQSRAAAQYAEAAAQTRDARGAAALWERACAASNLSADFNAALERADTARELYASSGDAVSAARMDSVAATTLSRLDHNERSRQRFAVALEVLRPARVAETAMTLARAAETERELGGDSDRLSAEAVDLGEQLGMEGSDMAFLLGVRATVHSFAGHRVRSLAYYREAARYALQSKDDSVTGRVFMNLAVELIETEPHAAVEAAQTALDHLRRIGDRGGVALTVANLSEVLTHIGDWDGAVDLVRHAIDIDGLGDLADVKFARAAISALRGDRQSTQEDAAALTAMNREIPDYRATVEGTWAALFESEGDTASARAHALEALEYRKDTGIRFVPLRWSWSLASRLAHDAGDFAAEQELIDLLASYSDVAMGTMHRAERDLAVARIAGVRGDPEAATLMEAAVRAQRESSTPFHLAHGLIDAHDLYRSLGRETEAAAALSEALEIGRRLGAAPLIRRAEEHSHIASPVRSASA